MWTCIECEFKYSDDNGDSEERMCDSCLNKQETEKREKELMEEEKMYFQLDKVEDYTDSQLQKYLDEILDEWDKTIELYSISDLLEINRELTIREFRGRIMKGEE